MELEIKPVVEPTTILQPSLHTMEEYFGMVASEAECRGVAVDDTYDEEHVSEAIDTILDAIRDADYYVVEESDCLAIYPRGEHTITPEEGDYVILDCGVSGWQVSNLDEEPATELDEIAEQIHNQMELEGFFPNIWLAYDHSELRICRIYGGECSE